jgi:hypothetical protein
MDLARSWAPILMRSNGESAIAEDEQELQVRVIQTLITSAEEIFESDPTEKYADPSFSSVTLMPSVRTSATAKSERSRTESSSASTRVFRSIWQSEISSVPRVVSKCTEIIESSDWKSQIYYSDAPRSEVNRAMSLLMSRKSAEVVARYQRQQLMQLTFCFPSESGLKPVETRHAALGLFAVATLLKELIAAKPNPLVALEESNLITVATVTSTSGQFM